MNNERISESTATREIKRVRHELVRRSLEVVGVEYVTPQMLRLTFGGKSLSSLTTLAPDDHVKVFVQHAGVEISRQYTIRSIDKERSTLTLDFAIHDAGPVTDWARSVRIGDNADIAGPRGSGIVPDEFDWWLLIGDETGMPAIARRLEELSAGRVVTSIVSVISAAEEQTFSTPAQHSTIWIHRPLAHADDPAPIIAALKQWKQPAGDGFIWIATESSVARALRTHVTEVMGHPLSWVKAAGYWSKGLADTVEKFEPASASTSPTTPA